MLLGTVIDVAVILAALYVALSCACSWLNERLAAVTRMRGQTLYQGVLNLVVGELPVVEGIFSHPLIACSSNDKDGKITTERHGVPRNYRPSYIEARNFSLSFWDSIRNTQRLPIGGAVTDDVALGPSLVKEFTDRVGAMPRGGLRDALVALLNEAQGDYAKLLKTTDDWFNAQMDRVSGWYRRRTQWILVIIAFLVTAAGGIDSLEIGQRAAVMDPEYRRQLIQQISDATNADASTRAAAAPTGVKLASNSQSPVGTFNNSKSKQHIATVLENSLDCKLPSGAESSPKTLNDVGKGGTERASDRSSNASGRLEPQDASPNAASACSGPYVVHFPWLSAATWWQHVPGMIITLVALSLGGPFWFDLLCTIVNVRQTGPKPKPSVTKP